MKRSEFMRLLGRSLSLSLPLSLSWTHMSRISRSRVIGKDPWYPPMV